MLYFFIAYGFDTAFILTLLFHVLVLWQLIRASVAAKRLARGEYEEDAAQEPASGETPTAPDADRQAAETRFPYDRAYASAAGANKTGKIVLTVLLFFTWMAAGAGLSLWLLEEKLALGFGVAIPAIVVICLAAVVWFIVSVIRLSAFLEAPFAVYYIDEAGILTRDKTDLPPFHHTVFHGLEVAEARGDRWVVRYEYPIGKPRKAVIPNAYPGLERYMAALPERR